MPRTGGVYSPPAGTKGVPNTTIQSVPYNTLIDDLTADANAARPVTAGGTGATSASGARTALGVAIDTNVQAYDAGLQSISGLVTVADQMIYTTALDVYATTALTPFARTLLDDANASTALTTLGVSTFIKTVLDDADAATARATLGADNASNLALGTVADARLPTTMTGKTFSGAVTMSSTLDVNANLNFSATQGRGLRFWDGNDEYAVYMSAQADATYGGRLDGSSDYNMYFRMGAGAGRGFVFKNGTTAKFQITGGGEAISASPNNYRIIYGNYGQFWRFDGANLYLMFTASGDQAGGYNALRPIAVNAVTGNVTMGHGLSVTGAVAATGEVHAGASRHAVDGNIFGTLWGSGGDWLSNYLANQFAGKVSVGGRAYPLRVGGVDLNFNWSGQAGQPPWLWGGSDGSNMYVYNPSNFSVNYANSAGSAGSAGNADTVDGYHAIDLAQIYKGTNHAETNLNIGHILLMSDSGMFARNGDRTPTLYTGNTTQYIQNGMGGAGSILAGTWRLRGYASSNIGLLQRVA